MPVLQRSTARRARPHFAISYSAAVMALSPVGYWRLDETTGPSAIDFTGNGNTGTYRASGETLGTTGLIAGDSDTAVTFAGTGTSGIDFGSPTDLHLTTATLIAWIKTSGAGASFRGIAVNQGAFALFLNGNSFATFDWTGIAVKDSGINVADGAKHMVGLTFQSGVTNGSQLWLDGTSVLTYTATVAAFSGFAIGDGSTNPGDGTYGGQEYAGIIDEVAMFGSLLSSTQFSNLNSIGH